MLKDGVAANNALAELFKLAGRKIIEALVAGVSDVLDWSYDERGAAPERGYQNRSRRGRLRTAAGGIEYGVPKVTDRAEPFVSSLRAGLTGWPPELERLAVELSARGLSTHDIEHACLDADGQNFLSRTDVS